MDGMENSTFNKTECICDITNASCWKALIDDKNQEYSDQNVPVTAMMAFFLIIGIPGNIVVIVMYSTRTKVSTANVFILFLAIIDLFACVVIHPYVVFKIYNYYDQTWVIPCKIFEFLVHLNLVMSGLTLLLVAIDRYLAICEPVKFLRFDRHVLKAIVSISALSLTVSLPLLEFYGPNPNTYVLDNCSVVGYRCDYQSKYQGSTLYTAFSAFIMTGFIAEIVAMTILYKSVAVVAYKSRRSVFPLSNAHLFAGIQPSTSGSDTMTASTAVSKGQSLSKVDLSPTYPSPIPLNVTPAYDQQRSHMFYVNSGTKVTPLRAQTHFAQSGNDVRKNIRATYVSNVNATTNRFRNRLKAAKLLFFVTFVFFLSWMPFFILRVCYTLNTNACRMNSHLGYVIENVINHVFYINNAINPVLYTALNKTFRTEFSLLVKKRFRGFRH